MRGRWINMSVLLAVVALALPAGAQSTTTGSVRGTVTDPDGGILPGATVRALSDALVAGQLVAFVNAQGIYRFPSLPPGTYVFEASLDGFRTVRRENVQVSLGTAMTVDLQMGMLETTDEIVVVAEATAVSTVSNTVAHNLDQEFLKRQPLPRDATDLMNYTPGVNAGLAYGSPSSQGSAYNLDGVDVSDPGSGGQWILPNFDWVEEVQVTGLGANAEYGGFTGAMVNLVTRSGGNELSGDVSLYYSDAGLNDENSPEGTESVNELDSDLDASVSLGGKLIQDKLWYFVSGQERERSVDPFYVGDAPLFEQGNTSDRSWSRYLGKLTYQADNDNRLVVLADYDGVEHDRRGLGEFVMASGAQTQDSPNWAYNATWESLVNDSNFVTVKLTGFDGTDDRLPPFGSDRPGREDDWTGLEWDNYKWTVNNDKQRVNLDASWSLFADGVLSAEDSHTFKFGVVYEDSSQDEVWTRNGGFSYYDDSYYCDSVEDYFANPECALFSSDRGDEIDLHAVQTGLHAYAQDSLKYKDVTLNFGVRYTSYEGGFDGGDEDVYSDDMISPRLGIVWDVGGRGSTALKVHYGRYYEGLFAFMYDREISGDVFSDLEFWDWDFDAGEWYYAGGRPSGGAIMDSEISHPYVDQYVASFEHQLTDTMLLGLDYVYRENSDIIAMINTNDDYDALVAPSNPITGGDLPFFELLSPQDFVLTNPDEATREYDSLIVRFNRRYADGWSLRASLVWSDLVGNTSDVDGYESAWEDWNGLVNNFGNLPNYSEWELKVNASVDLPWDIMASAYYLYRSGTYWTPYVTIYGLLENDRTTVNLTSLGSQQLDDRNLVDLHLEKAFALTSDMELTLMVDVFNVFNSDTVLAVSERWGFYDYVWDAHPEESAFDPSSSYQQPLAIEDAREVRLGVRLSF